MENKLEQLLNSLIQRGRVPFGEGCHRSPYKRVSIHKNHNKERTYVWFYSNNHTHWKVLRQVVSKESGLWQFCTEKGMVNNLYCTWDKYDGNDCPVPNQQHLDKYYEYRLIESSLIDESELEKFLINSIVIKDA